RVGNRAFAQAFASAVPSAVRIERVEDPIPRVPPFLPLMRYVHVGRLLMLRPDGSLATPAELDQGLATRLRPKLHFNPEYVRILERLLALCGVRAAECEDPRGTDRLAAVGDAERSFAERWAEAGLSLLRRLFGL